MGLLKALIRTVVEIPIAVTKDVFTLGGAATGKDESYTKETYEELLDEIDKKSE